MTNVITGYFWFNSLVKNTSINDYYKTDPGLAADQNSCIDSAALYLKMIDFEKSYLGGDASKIFIGGESMGCMQTLDVLVRYADAQPLGGVMCFYGYTPISTTNFINNSAV